MRACLTFRLPLLAIPRAQPAQRVRWRPLITALAVVLGMGLALPAMAQVPGTEDLRALLYYLDHNDQRSVQAEMRRLRAQFPGWTPPGDLEQLRAQGQAPSATADVAGIWARIERGDYPGARALIDQTRQNVPSWSPDAEMLRVLELNESQQAFDAAVARGDHTAAIAAARRSPGLMRCDRINNAWQLAEMYHVVGQRETAVATYRGVLSSCTRPAEVVPTLEKANEIATLEQLSALFQTARSTAPGNAQTLDPLEARLRAGRGAPAGGATAATATPRASAPAAPAAASPAAPAAPVSAAPVSSAPPAAVPPGALGSLALRGDARISRTRALKEAGDWGSCLAQSANPRSLELLYERAWCAYNLDRTGEALAAFAAVARNGGGLGAGVARDASFGLTLAYLAHNMTEEAARVAASTNLERGQRVEVETIILDQRGVRAYHLGEYEQSIAYLDALETLTGTLRRDLAMLRAYAHMNLRNLETAREQFARLHSQLATAETRDALQSLAGMASGE